MNDLSIVHTAGTLISGEQRTRDATPVLIDLS